MHKKLSATYFSIDSKNIDTPNGVIKNVVICNEGLNKNGDNLDTTFLEQIALLGNAQSMGVKARFGHPNMCDSSMGAYIGRYKNFSLDGGSVIADLHLDKVADTSPKGKLFSYVLEMSKTNPDMFGNSISYNADKPVEKSENINGELVTKMYERAKSLTASDLVDSPAGTTSLFMSTQAEFAVKATEFMDENPEFFEVLSANPNTFNEFLKKYSEYKNKKAMGTTETKSLKEKVLNSLKTLSEFVTGESKDFGIKIACTNGKMLELDDPNNDGKADVGDNATIGGEPAEPGDYTATATGETYTIGEGSVVTEVKPKPAKPGAPKPDPNEDKEGEMAAKDLEIQNLKKQLSEKDKAITDLKSENETALSAINEQITELKTQITSKGFDLNKVNKENSFQKKDAKEASTKEDSRADREARKEQYTKPKAVK